MKLTLRRPKAGLLPDCVTGPAAMPKLDPRPMPALPLACPRRRTQARNAIECLSGESSSRSKAIELQAHNQGRKRAIGEILEARFTLGAFEEARRTDPPYWASPRNDMGRGIYGQAIREKRRLQNGSGRPAHGRIRRGPPHRASVKHPWNLRRPSD